jgi:hypothetical protein
MSVNSQFQGVAAKPDRSERPSDNIPCLPQILALPLPRLHPQDPTSQPHRLNITATTKLRSTANKASWRKDKRLTRLKRNDSLEQLRLARLDVVFLLLACKSGSRAKMAAESGEPRWCVEAVDDADGA